jgi:hypothetical protein
VSFDLRKLRVAGLWIAVAAAIVAALSVLGPLRDAPTSGDGSSQDVGGAPASRPPGPSAPARIAEPLPNPGRGRVAGFVRDVNGNPVPRARVRIGGTRRGTRANSRGRYSLRLPRRARTLVAEHRGHAAQAVALTARGVGRRRVDFSLAATSAGRVAGPNSADVLVFWANCPMLAELSPAQLDRLMGLGVDGFVCMAGRLHTMGGTYRFAANGSARLAGAAYELQRSLRESAIVKLARRGRLKLFLGFKAADYYNAKTPFQEWFDDAAWSREVLTPVRKLAAAARSLSFVGVALDQELYPATGGAVTASWSWNYPGNHHSEREVRAQVERRGRQLMSAMLAGFPGLELAAYATAVPGNWEETVQKVINGHPDAFADDVRVDLWAGLSSVPGYAAIYWLDAIFYKAPHVGRDWSVALQQNANGIYSELSRRFPNWRYAASRLHVTPFSWISPGPSDSRFDDARDPAYVAAQLDAFRPWGTGGMFANYAYRGPLAFDYTPYADALRRASTPSVVDQEPPRLSVTAPAGAAPIAASGGSLDIEGTAHDNFAIRVVRWYDGHDRFGTAKLVWEPEDPLGEGSRWITRWQISGVPLSPGRNRITVVAEDIKGLATLHTLTIRRSRS